MAFQLKDGQGSLFKNDRDQKKDYNGSCRIDGVEYWISGWIKRPKSGGKPYISLAIEPKQQRSYRAPEPGRDYQTPLDDEIPF